VIGLTSGCCGTPFCDFTIDPLVSIEPVCVEVLLPIYLMIEPVVGLPAFTAMLCVVEGLYTGVCWPGPGVIRGSI
jgi:hypothetical protein